MITKQDLEALNGLVDGSMTVNETNFCKEATEGLTVLALIHFPSLRVIDSAQLVRLEEKISRATVELETELHSLLAEPVVS